MLDSIHDINDRFTTPDELPNTLGDDGCVVCGRNDDYSELTYIYSQLLAPKVAAHQCTEQDVLKALEKACTELPTPRDRADFYAFLENELGVDLAY